MVVVAVIAYNINNATEAARTIVAPDPTSFGPPEQTSHASSNATGAALAIPLEPGQHIQVRIDPDSLNPLNSDSVDIFGVLSISNMTGENFISCQYSANDLTSSTKITPGVLVMTRSIGTDLTVADGNTIISEMGGLFNIVLNAQASWN